MTTYVIRHGETEDNTKGLMQGWSDSPLTEAGETSAEQVVKGVEFCNPYIISSSLGRAVSTAQIIRETLGIRDDILSEPNLRERGLGDYEGQPIDVIFDLVEAMGFARTPEGIYRAEIEGVESIQNIRDRVAEIDTDMPGRDVLLVGHCLSNNYFCEHADPKGFEFYGGRDLRII